MELPIETTAPGASPPKRRRVSAGEWAIAVALLRSLTLAAGGGIVFYASIRPVTIDTGFLADLVDFPWLLAWLGLAAAWLAGPVIVLVLGLVHLLRRGRRRWGSAAAWVVALAAGVGTGFLIMHCFHLLFTAYSTDSAGDPLGPSRWAHGGPYWLALVAAGSELALCAILTALAKAPLGKQPEGSRLSG